ncbi:hypothetical protein BC830DRAFT_819181 [Chytriomyces sp. MP71]|nr:hypothetical protein BC830DRAFT_819181 [Chytriomyces sp. MP71]
MAPGTRKQDVLIDTLAQLGGGSVPVIALATPALADKPTSRQRNFHGVHGIYHGLSKQENKDTSLSFQVRQAIIDNNNLRNQTYEPDRVTMRTELKYASRDPKLIAAVKIKRQADVERCGFRSDAKEPYKPLGEPIVDSDMLLYKSLKIDPGSFHRVSRDKHHDVNSKPMNEEAVNERHKTRRGPRPDNGLGIIKEKLAQSRKRLHAVRFGLSFTEVCDDPTRLEIEEPEKRTDVDIIDWNNLKIDTEKQTLFQNMLEKHRVAWLDKNYPELAQKDDPVTSNFSDTLPSILSKTLSLERTFKETEEELQIPPHPSLPETMERFFVTREKFYEQQAQQNQILQEDLDCLDLDRKQIFQTKYRSFRIGKDFGDDMRHMRARAVGEIEQSKAKVLRRHPWYYDLVRKVSASSKHLSKVEELLLDRIRGHVEHGQDFTQKVFVQLMKLIPERAFNDDAVQRIIRFVKQHSSISERDYLEAIELSGHGLALKRLEAKSKANMAMSTSVKE